MLYKLHLNFWGEKKEKEKVKGPVSHLPQTRISGETSYRMCYLNPWRFPSGQGGEGYSWQRAQHRKSLEQETIGECGEPEELRRGRG